MSHIFVRSERVIDASPDTVFRALADYEVRRPRILPPNYQDYRLERSARDGAPVMHYHFQAAGRERDYAMRVEETVPGQMLTERDMNSSLVTRWNVLPMANSQQTRVIVESDWQGGSGVGGFFEGTFAPLGLRKIYDQTLLALAMMVQSPATNQEMLQQAEAGSLQRANLPILLALVGVLALTLGLKYLRNQISE